MRRPKQRWKFFRSMEIEVYAATPRAPQTTAQADFRGPCALAIGSEAHGVNSLLQSAAGALFDIRDSAGWRA